MLPVDPVLAVVGDRASPSVHDEALIELDLDEPPQEPFWIYLQKVFSSDFGQSFLTKRLIDYDIRRVFPATVELAGVGILIGAFPGIPMGVLAAVKQGKLVDRIARVLSLIGHSAPIFWLGLNAILVFYAKLGWAAAPDGRISIDCECTVTQTTGFLPLDTAMRVKRDGFRNVLCHLVMPATLPGCYSMAHIGRMTRSFMLNELAQEYVITARVKGAPEWRIIRVHALRNAAVPLVTVVALSYASLPEGSVLTETVFAWPGLGRYPSHSLQDADMNAVLGGTLVIGVFFVGLNLLSDLFYALLAPRVRRRA